MASLNRNTNRTTNQNTKNCGQLYIVATPIGNLADITLRALEILRQADLIAAEDTRMSQRLLGHHGISSELISCHAHNEEQTARQLLARLEAGQTIALISDAGTPLISDPGARLVQLIRQAGIRVTPIPGPSSPIAALSASGLPSDRFTFFGFLPRSGGERQRLLQTVAASPVTSILFESPRRLVDTLDDLIALCGPKRAGCVARELTKIYEEFLTEPLEMLRCHFADHEPRGEIVLLIAPRETAAEAEASDEQILAVLHDNSHLPPSERARQAARLLDIPRERAYKLLMAEREFSPISS